MKRNCSCLTSRSRLSIFASPTWETCLELGSSDTSLKDAIALHLLSMADQFTVYFPVNARTEWIRDPFSADAAERPDDLTDAEQDRLLELSSGSIPVL